MIHFYAPTTHTLFIWLNVDAVGWLVLIALLAIAAILLALKLPRLAHARSLVQVALTKHTPALSKDIDMNLFLKILQGFLQAVPLAPTIITGIEVIHGKAVNGATKMDLAKQSLNLAVATASGLPLAILNPGNAALAQIFGGITSTILNSAYSTAKTNGSLNSAVVTSYNLPATATVADLNAAIGASAAPASSVLGAVGQASV